MRVCTLLVAACLCLLSSGAAAQDAKVRAAVERGAQAMRQGNSAAAEEAFREAARLAPRLPEPYVDLGLVLGREGKMEEAIALLQKALALDPNANSAHMFLGIFLYTTNQLESAREQLMLELARHPDSAEALTWLGTVDLSLAHPERAAASLDRAAELAPNDLNILELRGKAHSLVARESYARMASLEPNSWHVHRVQAQLYTDEGKHVEAVAELEAAIKLQPGSSDLYESLGDEYRSLSKLDAAEKAYEKGLELGPANPVALYNLGSVKVENGDSADGVPLLLRMTQVYPGSPVAEYYLGRGLASLGRNDEAVAWLSKSAMGNNSEVAKRATYELVRTYRRLGRAEDALAAQASYNRMRLSDDQRAGKQVEDWRNLQQAQGRSAAP